MHSNCEKVIVEIQRINVVINLLGMYKRKENANLAGKIYSFCFGKADYSAFISIWIITYGDFKKGSLVDMSACYRVNSFSTYNKIPNI